MLQQYSKFIVSAITAALVAFQTALADGNLTSQDWFTIILAGVGAFGVWAVPNTKPTPPTEDKSA